MCVCVLNEKRRPPNHEWFLLGFLQELSDITGGPFLSEPRASQGNEQCSTS